MSEKYEEFMNLSPKDRLIAEMKSFINDITKMDTISLQNLLVDDMVNLLNGYKSFITKNKVLEYIRNKDEFKMQNYLIWAQEIDIDILIAEDILVNLVNSGIIKENENDPKLFTVIKTGE